jgi:hypothetical protein
MCMVGFVVGVMQSSSLVWNRRLKYAQSIMQTYDTSS